MGRTREWSVPGLLGRVAGGVLLVAGAATVFYSALHALTAGANDFQWSGARSLAHGVDPYRLILAGDRSQVVMTQFPNYAPLLYVLLLPFGLLTLATATLIWTVLNVALLLIAALWVGCAVRLSRWRLAAFVAVFAASWPVAIVLSSGQQVGMSLVMAVLATGLSRQRWTGPALGVMLVKYSFAPVALVPLLRGRLRTVLVAGALQVTGLLVFCLVSGSPLLATIPAPLHTAQLTEARGAGDVMTLARLLGAGELAVFVLGAVMLALLAWFARDRLRSAHWVDSLAAASLVSLMVFPHLYYDYCFLLPVLGSALLRRGAGLWIPVVVVAIVWFAAPSHALWGFEYEVSGITVTLLLLLSALVSLVREAPRPHANRREAASEPQLVRVEAEV